MVTVLIAAGCGGDDDGGEPLTKEEFITQADAVCTEGDQRLEDATQELTANPSQEEVEAFVSDTLVPSLQEEHDGIAELAPPEEDQETIDAMLSDLSAGIDEIRADPSLVFGDENPLADASAAAQEYGMTVCGSDAG
jgi:hypothetical protein